jgi:hypothetical protein
MSTQTGLWLHYMILLTQRTKLTLNTQTFFHYDITATCVDTDTFGDRVMLPDTLARRTSYIHEKGKRLSLSTVFQYAIGRLHKKPIGKREGGLFCTTCERSKREEKG